MNSKLRLSIVMLLTTILAIQTTFGQNDNCLALARCSNGQLSPNGDYLAIKRKDEQNKTALLLIHISDLKSETFYPRNRKSEKVDVIDFAWSTNDTLILTAAISENDQSLHKLTASGNKIETIESHGVWEIVDSMPHNTNYIVSVREFKWDTGECELQLRDLEKPESVEKLYACKSKDFTCVTDNKHEPRLIKRNSTSPNQPEWYWNNGEAWVQTALPGWTTVFATEFGNPNRVFAAGYFNEPTPSVSVYDLPTEQPIKKILEHPDFEINRYASPIMNAHPNAMMGVRLQTAIPQDIWLTKLMANLQQKVDEAMPGTTNQILSWDQKMKQLLVKRTTLDSPSHFVWFNTEDSTAKLLIIDGGDIREANIGGSKAIQIETNDGTILPAFLTIPFVKTPQQLPMVVYFEKQALEGVIAMEWSPVASYIATQGFVVLRMNTRATPGFLKGNPKAFNSLAGMQTLFDDIDKGIQDLVGAGLVDPERIAIAGEGAGAWIATIAPSRCKSKFQSVAAFNGVYDLERYRSEYGAKDPMQYAVALPFANPDSGIDDSGLNKLSPIENFENFPDGLFLTLGKWSSESFKDQISDYKSKAKKNGITVKSEEGDWWGSNMLQAPFINAWKEATSRMKEDTNL